MNKQLSFADLDTQDLRPIPLIVADKWQFSLSYLIINSVHYFSIIDWIAGIGSSDIFRAEDTWRKLQSALRISNPPLVPLDYATDKQLYDIAQNMRVTKQRPALKEIQDYLSKAGALLDEWRRDPEKMLSTAQARVYATIERHERAGFGHHPNIEHLKSEFEVTKSVKAVNDMFKRVVESPEFGRLHNAKLEALFGFKSKQIKAILGCQDIHKGLPTMQLDTLDFAHKQIIQILQMQAQGKISNERAMSAIEIAVKPLGDYLRNLCDTLGIDPITGKPLLKDKNKEKGGLDGRETT